MTGERRPPVRDERPAPPAGGGVAPASPGEQRARPAPPAVPPAVPEIGGPQGPEPTRYGDWEKGGRCTDF